MRMPQCNIDQRGRLVRFFLGFFLFFLGSILFVAAIPGTGAGWRTFQTGVMIFGVFVMTEGVMGWCALRAMGKRTRL
jgi:hypothetical protein